MRIFINSIIQQGDSIDHPPLFRRRTYPHYDHNSTIQTQQSETWSSSSSPTRSIWMVFPLWTFSPWINSLLWKGILTFFPHTRGDCAKRECCKCPLWAPTPDSFRSIFKRHFCKRYINHLLVSYWQHTCNNFATLLRAWHKYWDFQHPQNRRKNVARMLQVCFN